MKDPQEYEGCLNLKLEILGDGLKTKEDSVNYCNKLKDLYAEHKTDGVMEKLYNTLQAMGEKDAANKILDDALAANPDNFVALADKGLGLLQTNPAEAARRRPSTRKPSSTTTRLRSSIPTVCRATGVTTATMLTTTSTVLTILRPSRQRPTASNPTD